MTRGRFFVLDGIDGCGKSTQAGRLVAALARAGRRTEHLREPGSTPAGERIRALLLDPEVALGPEVETLLFVAARRQMLDERVRPALDAGADVVCERFHPATFAYQAVAAGVGEERVLALLGAWAGAPAPDLAIVLDVPVDEALRRRASSSDRFESRGAGFQARVADGLRRYAAHDAALVFVDGRGTSDEVAARGGGEVSRVA
jgi:dTMP kinase